jgi:hypothetical protein
MAAFILWFPEKEKAQELCEMARSGVVSVGELLDYYKAFVPLKAA